MRNTDKDIDFMFKVEEWLVMNDVKDNMYSFEYLKNHTLSGYLYEVKEHLSWKAPDLIAELRQMEKNYKSIEESRKPIIEKESFEKSSEMLQEQEELER